MTGREGGALPIRDDLLEATAYGAPTDDVPVRLNVNENPYAPPQQVVAAIAAAVTTALESVNRYPDREALALRAALADYIGVGVTAGNVWPANGSNEVMQQIFTAFGGPGRSAMSFAPTYSMYPIYARDTFTEYVVVPRGSDHTLDWQAITEQITVIRPSVVVVASPNNPTGTPLHHPDIRRLHELVAPFAVLVVDEAYQEFSNTESAVTLLAQLPRLVVTRTLSKALGAAGLRVGYAITSPEIVDALRLVRLPYHLSVITQAAAIVAISHAEWLLRPVTEVVAEREKQFDWLRANDIPVIPSQAYFLLIGPFAESHKTFLALLDRGVLVRETSVPACLRVSIGTPAENESFRNALINEEN